MEVTRRTNNNQQLSRSSFIRDWAPTLVRLGKMAYQSAQQSKTGKASAAGDGGSDFITQSIGAPRNRRRNGRKSGKQSKKFEGVPRHVLGSTISTTIRGSIICQGTGGTYQGSFLVGFDVTNSLNQLVNQNNMFGNDYGIIASFGFIKYHKITVSLHPVLAATDSGFAALGVRSIVDNSLATPSYIKKMPGSKTWVLPGKESVSYEPDVNGGVIHRTIQTEVAETEDEHTYLGNVKVYITNASSPTSAVMGILKWEIDVSAWND